MTIGVAAARQCRRRLGARHLRPSVFAVHATGPRLRVYVGYGLSTGHRSDDPCAVLLRPYPASPNARTKDGVLRASQRRVLRSGRCIDSSPPTSPSPLAAPCRLCSFPVCWPSTGTHHGAPRIRSPIVNRLASRRPLIIRGVVWVCARGQRPKHARVAKPPTRARGARRDIPMSSSAHGEVLGARGGRYELPFQVRASSLSSPAPTPPFVAPHLSRTGAPGSLAGSDERGPSPSCSQPFCFFAL